MPSSQLFEKGETSDDVHYSVERTVRKKRQAIDFRYLHHVTHLIDKPAKPSIQNFFALVRIYPKSFCRPGSTIC